jgi:hypothetical protein
MCPYCQAHDHRACPVRERADGRLTCACGRHSWPNGGAFAETCRQMSLTITGQLHVWTQSY